METQLPDHYVPVIVKLASALAPHQYRHFHHGMGSRRKKKEKERNLHDNIYQATFNCCVFLNLESVFSFFLDSKSNLMSLSLTSAGRQFLEVSRKYLKTI